MNRIIQAGEYPLTGESFQIRDRKILIRHRKEISEKKPEMFLSAVKPYCYVSSLYPFGEDYSLDEQGKRFVLSMDEKKVVIVST